MLNKLAPKITCPPLSHTASHRNPSFCSASWTHRPSLTFFRMTKSFSLLVLRLISSSYLLGERQKHRQAAGADRGSWRCLLEVGGSEFSEGFLFGPWAVPHQGLLLLLTSSWSHLLALQVNRRDNIPKWKTQSHTECPQTVLLILMFYFCKGVKPNHFFLIKT